MFGNGAHTLRTWFSVALVAGVEEKERIGTDGASNEGIVGVEESSGRRNDGVKKLRKRGIAILVGGRAGQSQALQRIVSSKEQLVNMAPSTRASKFWPKRLCKGKLGPCVFHM